MFAALLDFIPTLISVLVGVTLAAGVTLGPLLALPAVVRLLHQRMLTLRSGAGKGWVMCALYGVLSVELAIELTVRLAAGITGTGFLGAQDAGLDLLLGAICGLNLIALIVMGSYEVEERRVYANREQTARIEARRAALA